MIDYLYKDITGWTYFGFIMLGFLTCVLNMIITPRLLWVILALLQLPYIILFIRKKMK
jgi:hypothetical protein